MKRSAYYSVLLLVLFCFGSFNYKGSYTKPGTRIGDAAPNFKAVTTDGHPITLEQFKGKVVLLNFWASYDPYSRIGQISFNDIYKKYENSRFEFGNQFDIIGVSYDRYDSLVEISANNDGILWQNQIADYADNNGQISSMYKNERKSGNILIDGRGNILARNLDAEDLDAILNRFRIN